MKYNSINTMRNYEIHKDILVYAQASISNIQRKVQLLHFGVCSICRYADVECIGLQKKYFKTSILRAENQ